MNNSTIYSSRTILILTISVLLLILSCGSPEKPSADADSDTTRAMTPEPRTYDRNAIDPTASVVEIEVRTTGNNMQEMKYDKSEIRVKKGTTIHLKIINEAKDSAMQHNLVIIRGGSAAKVANEGLTAGKDAGYVPDIPEMLAATPLAGPGETKEIKFPAPPVGEYPFICTYPGHYTMMNGKFVVEE